MIDVDAAFLIAFMLAAGAFFGATFFAACVIGTRRQLAAFNHLIHVATATFDSRLLVAGRAIAQMTFTSAMMRIGSFTTTQRLTANALAHGYGIEAGFTRACYYRQFAARTRSHNRRALLARPTLAGMATVLAFVIATSEFLTTWLATGIVALFMRIARTGYLPLLFGTMTDLLHLLRTGCTLALMTFGSACVQLTVQQFTANGIAEYRFC